MVAELLNQRSSLSQLTHRISRLSDRTWLNSLLFRVLLVVFGAFCLLQYYLYRVLLSLFAPLNWLFGAVGWVPLVTLQNQLVYKADLIGHCLERDLQAVLSSDDPAVVLRSYFAVLNTLVFMVVDCSLGLLSLVLSYAFILGMMRVLRFVTHTVHLLFLEGKFWASALQRVTELSPTISGYGEVAIGRVLDCGRYITFTFDDLFSLYKCVAYLGLSCQILLTAELAYLSSLHILALYKCIAGLYRQSLRLIRLLHSIATCTMRNNLTQQIPPLHLNPAVKVGSAMTLLLLASLLPSIVLHYLWFIASVLLFRLAINALRWTVHLANHTPFAQLLGTIKRPELYPGLLTLRRKGLHWQVEARPMGRLPLVCALLKSKWDVMQKRSHRHQQSFHGR